MIVVVMIVLLVIILGCAAWLVRDDRRTAASERLERRLRASRHRDPWRHG